MRESITAKRISLRAFFVAVRMVHVGEVGVFVRCWFVDVLVRMFAREGHVVSMSVMTIVVPVSMFVDECIVRVRMLVFLGDVERESNEHERERDRRRRAIETLAKDARQGRGNKRCGSENRSRASSPNAPLRQ